MSRYLSMKLLFFLILILCSSKLHAEDPIAKIQKIADVSQPKPIKITTVTDRVKVQQKGTGEWENAYPKYELFLRDKILIKKFIRVILEIKSKDQRGKIIMLSDSLSSQKETALYEIQENPQKLGQAEVIISYGSLIVDWLSGAATLA